MTCQRPDTGIMLTTKEYLMTIGIEMLTLNVEIFENRVDLPLCHRWETIRQLNPSNNTVPIGLRIFGIGMTVGIDLLWHTTTIIDHNSESMIARSQHLRKIKHLRCGDIVRHSNKFPIDIDLRGFSSLQHQINGFAFPLGRNLNSTAVPGTALVGIEAGKVCRLLCLTNEIAFFVGVSRSWQLYHLSHGIVCLYRTLTIQCELPRATQVNMFRLILCLHIQTEDSH